MYNFPHMDSQAHLRATDSQSASVYRTRNLSTLSLASRYSVGTNRASALEIYDLVYTNTPMLSPSEVVDRIYETNAGHVNYVQTLARVLTLHRSYENPLITASSRQVIADINAVTRQLAQVDVPRPLAMFKTLFWPNSNSNADTTAPWFEAMRVWSDIEDVCESESFDGHHMSIIEHTLNILMLPGLHSNWRGTDNISSESLDMPSSATTLAQMHGGSSSHTQPSLAVPGLKSLSLPSPLHLKLHVMTRLSFNEQGRVTRHRDFWDVRDVLGLVPGVQAAQWIGTRMAARAVSVGAWFFGIGDRRGKGGEHLEDIERGRLMAAAAAATSPTTTDGGGRNALGLDLEDEHVTRARHSGLYVAPKRVAGPVAGAGQAPDVDR